MWAADRYGEASRLLLRAKALEAAASEFIVADDRDQARGAFTKAVEIYSALGAVTDVARLQTIFRAHGIRVCVAGDRQQKQEHRLRIRRDPLDGSDIRGAAWLELRRLDESLHVRHLLRDQLPTLIHAAGIVSSS